MPIVKGLLDQRGGTIDITSEVGVGSTFVIAIPFEIAPAPEVHPAKKTAAAGNIRDLHLLLAEDNDLNAEIAQVFLSDQGAAVTTVSDGRQAVDRFQLSAPGTFDARYYDACDGRLRRDRRDSRAASRRREEHSHHRDDGERLQGGH